MACPVFAEVAAFLSKHTLLVWGATCRQSLRETFEASGDAWVSVDLASWCPICDGSYERGDADLKEALGRIPPGRLRFLKMQGSFTDSGLASVLEKHSGLLELSLDAEPAGQRRPQKR
ncbi:unnamed protein product, partial [Symbiodinium pilosum]